MWHAKKAIFLRSSVSLASRHDGVTVESLQMPPEAASWQAFDHLTTMVAVVRPDGRCVFANAAFESVLGLSRRSVLREFWFDWFADPNTARETALAVMRGEFVVKRFEAALHRNSPAQALPVLVTASPLYPASQEGWVLVELVEIEQHTRQDREARLLDQALLNKELIRNLAHEIKNPLGGIRGAAQLLEMELTPQERGLAEYTQVIIHEADRLQVLVDRLLAPHRNPHVVGDVNIHEVCERVCALVLAQFPQGLQVQRDYDISIPEFRGDREQLIQAVLNVMHNAAQVLAERITQGEARITVQTRIARQVTLGKQRYPLALQLLIVDNGPGVPSSIRDRIFFPLVSGRDGGTGLGLTLAQTFVQQHMGSIECDSEPGKTVFKILIPLP
jgi:two-component system, NtrC family, nitrogen regulation sensor histidine kinase GlnL